jgi:hypothetical protein
MKIPDCNELFTRFFVPWYPEGERGTLKATKGDMITERAYAARSAADVSNLTPQAQTRVEQQLERMLSAARTDWPKFLQIDGEVDLRWVQAFDEYYDQERIANLIRSSNPAEDGNDYMITAIEFGVVLGDVLLQAQPRLAWSAAMPYWESAVYDCKSGTFIPVTHWAIKKLSDYGWDDGFADKVQACVALLDEEAN